MNCIAAADVAVIGAGLTGSCVALELARQGYSVALLDQDEMPMNRASRRNEGKIHLGLIYAAAPSFDTAELQLRGALNFSLLLERWIGDAVHDLQSSAPFIYLVAEDSLLDATALSNHYKKVEKLYSKLLMENPSLSYLGTRPEYLTRQIDPSSLQDRLKSSGWQACFETSELAIDTDQLANLITRAIDRSERISFYPAHITTRVESADGAFTLSGESRGGCWSLMPSQVVNAAWDGRLALDAKIGLSPTTGWLYRLKYRVLAEVPAELRGGPSVTMVLGPYGDVVMRPNRTVYLSWYPAGMRGWSDALLPPAEWQAACRGDQVKQREKIIAETIRGIEPWYPGIGACKPFQVDAGVIVAYGRTDVDDPGSDLHHRTRVGVTSAAGYHSVDPGKLTTAPYFATQAAERVIARFEQSKAPISVTKQ